MVTKYQQQSPVQINCTRTVGFNCLFFVVILSLRTKNLFFCVLSWNILRSICMRKYNATFASSHIFSHQKNERMRMTLRIVRVCVYVRLFCFVIASGKNDNCQFCCLFVCLWVGVFLLFVRYVVSYCE